MNKQETLEEAAERFSENNSIYDSAKDDTEYGFINGAKWQQERMYSEEDMIRFGAFMQQRHTGVKESLNQFKKK